MSKKDYEKAASMIAEKVLYNFTGPVQSILEDFCIEFFRDDNARFDEDRFKARIEQRIANKNPWGKPSEKRAS